jgi:hypothetical protein
LLLQTALPLSIAALDCGIPTVKVLIARSCKQTFADQGEAHAFFREQPVPATRGSPLVPTLPRATPWSTRQCLHAAFAALHPVLHVLCPSPPCDGLNSHFLITENNGIRVVLFGMHNRTFGPYFTAMNRILISVALSAAQATWEQAAVSRGFRCASPCGCGLRRPCWTPREWSSWPGRGAARHRLQPAA